MVNHTPTRGLRGPVRVCREITAARLQGVPAEPIPTPLGRRRPLRQTTPTRSALTGSAPTVARSSALSVALAVALVVGATGCTETQQRLGERAFIEAVNLKCRTDRARLSAARRIGIELAATPAGQGVTADLRRSLDDVTDAWESLRSTARSLRGPKVLQDELDAGLARLKELPGAVSDRTLTPAEAAQRIDDVRSDLRARGFVDCV
jgi:hypothetical protein